MSVLWFIKVPLVLAGGPILPPAGQQSSQADNGIQRGSTGIGKCSHGIHHG